MWKVGIFRFFSFNFACLALGKDASPSLEDILVFLTGSDTVPAMGLIWGAV